MRTSFKKWSSLVALALPAFVVGACSATSTETSTAHCTGSECSAMPPGAVAVPPSLARTGAAHATVDGDARSGKIALFAADRSLMQRIEYTLDATGRRVHVVANGHTYDVDVRDHQVTVVLDDKETVRAIADDASRSWKADARARALLASAEAPISAAMHAVEALAPKAASAAPARTGAAPTTSAGFCGDPGASCGVNSDCCSGTCLWSGECGAAGGGGGSNGGIGGGSAGGGLACRDPNGRSGTLVGGTTVYGSSFFSVTKMAGCSAAESDVNNKCTNTYCLGCFAGSVNENWCSCNCLVGDTLCSYCGIQGQACDCYVPPGGGGSNGGTSGGTSGGGSSSGGWCSSTGSSCVTPADCCSNNCLFGTCS
jgi:hypothetical protein